MLYYSAAHDQVGDSQSDKSDGKENREIKQKFVKTAFGVVSAHVAAESGRKSGAFVLEQDRNG